jgi:hypothetical protein
MEDEMELEGFVEETYPSTAQPGAVGTTLMSETGTWEVDILLRFRFGFGFGFELFLVVSIH